MVLGQDILEAAVGLQGTKGMRYVRDVRYHQTCSDGADRQWNPRSKSMNDPLTSITQQLAARSSSRLSLPEANSHS